MNVRFYVLNVVHSSVFEKEENEMWTVPTEAERNGLIDSLLMSCWPLSKPQRPKAQKGTKRLLLTKTIVLWAEYKEGERSNASEFKGSWLKFSPLHFHVFLCSLVNVCRLGSFVNKIIMRGQKRPWHFRKDSTIISILNASVRNTEKIPVWKPFLPGFRCLTELW